MINIISLSFLAVTSLSPTHLTAEPALQDHVQNAPIERLSSDELSAYMISNDEFPPLCHVFSADPEGRECLFVFCYDNETGASWTDSCEAHGY